MTVVLVTVLGCLASIMLYGCGGGGTTTTTTTTTTITTTTTTRPLPPPPSGPFCTDAACCKKNAKGGIDQLCNDFYNTQNAISFTMLNTTTWHLNHGGFPGLDMDNAVFTQEPPAQFVKDAQQAMSLTHYQKGAEPYMGYGNNYGVAFPMGQPSSFWKYFQRSTTSGKLCGQCTDSQADCAPTQRRPIGDMSFEDFQQAKNAIISKTGTPACDPHLAKWQYNEFDTNGMSAKDVAGVFYCVNPAISKHAPQFNDATMCAFLHNRTQRQKNWPLYMYQFTHSSTSSLYLARYLDCASTTTAII